jgi:hypothetical protein
MNPSEALEWLLENGAEEESEDVAMNLKGEAACSVGPPRRQQEGAPGMMSLSCTHLFYKPLAHGLLEIND